MGLDAARAMTGMGGSQAAQSEARLGKLSYERAEYCTIPDNRE